MSCHVTSVHVSHVTLGLVLSCLCHVSLPALYKLIIQAKGRQSLNYMSRQHVGVYAFR